MLIISKDLFNKFVAYVNKESLFSYDDGKIIFSLAKIAEDEIPNSPIGELRINGCSIRSSKPTLNLNHLKSYMDDDLAINFILAIITNQLLSIKEEQCL